MVLIFIRVAPQQCRKSILVQPSTHESAHCSAIFAIVIKLAQNSLYLFQAITTVIKRLKELAEIFG